MAGTQRSLNEVGLCVYGQRGTTHITDTAIHTGETWIRISCKENTVFSTLTDTTRDGNTYSGETFPSGFDLYGRFTQIKLASGAVVAYKG